jgi:hypothetical protein
MAYIVKMTYTYPTNYPKFPPDKSMTFPISPEVALLREQFVRDGKILATDGYYSNDTYTGVNTVVFSSKAAFDEWSAIPIIADYFEKRNEFLSQRGISKLAAFTEV